MNKRIREIFNDGFLLYGQRKTVRTNGKKTGTEFTSEGRLAYKEMSIREQDYQTAAIRSSRLDLKVKTLYPPFFKGIRKNKLVVVIDKIEYDVILVDSDYSKNFLFFYLQEVGEVSE